VKSDIQQHERFPRGFPVMGYETNRYFLLDLDREVSLKEVKKKAFKIGKKYHLGDCLVVHSSDAKQMMLDLEPLQNYNLVYGRRLPRTYQQWVLKRLRESGIAIRYVEFREMEKSSTLRTSPKSEIKGSGNPIAFIKITGENEGIREYLKMLWVGRKLEKLLEKWRRESDELEEVNLLKSLGVIG
jgi:hypothetical protein